MADTQTNLSIDPACPSAVASWRDYAVLAKWRLNAMVLLTTFIGYLLAAGGLPEPIRALHAMIGVWLAAIGAGAINQYIERDVDKRMHRTRDRPLPSGRLTEQQAMCFGAVCLCGGILQLLVLVNALSAFLCVLTAVSYLFIYTPLKRISAVNTLVGAVPGALPPVIGWAAALNEVSAGSWALFAILFCWQLPHFFSIAWMYREDYARAGMQMISIHDDSGVRTGQHMVMSAMNLVFVSLLPIVVSSAGSLYFFAALLCGAYFVTLCVRFWRSPSRTHARSVMLGSLVYLPAILSLWLVDTLT
jgi:protoheme IX farnesyltransferase